MYVDVYHSKFNWYDSLDLHDQYSHLSRNKTQHHVLLQGKQYLKVVSSSHGGSMVHLKRVDSVLKGQWFTKNGVNDSLRGLNGLCK